MSIVIRTLSDRVFENVRERIVTGELREDTPIRQDALANELGVSKIPLREALARLEQVGLLTSQANRGYTIRGMSAAEVEEIYELRLAVEPVAAGYGAMHASAADQEAALTAYRLLDAAAAGDLPQVAVCNRNFHTALVRPGGRELTTQLVERLAVLAERYVVAHLKPAGREDRAHIEHRHLIDAWMARDVASLVSLMATHLSGTLIDLRTQFNVIAN